VKLRFTRSGAGGVRSVCERTVVRAFLLRPPQNPGYEKMKVLFAHALQLDVPMRTLLMILAVYHCSSPLL
jgi:hypothetical protein